MLLIILILLSIYLIIRFSDEKGKRKIQNQKDAFLQKERKANATRKRDISNLDYIKIPLETLPFLETEDETLISLQEDIKKLSKEPILNLTGLSNTDLKLEFGVANITFLSQCDENYTTLIMHLVNWGSYLFEHNLIKEATVVLELGIQYKSDISKNYTLLASIYKANNVPEKIDELIQAVKTQETLTKDSTLASLKEIQSAYF